MESKIIDLEIRIAHQDASIEELTHTVLALEKQQAKLMRELEGFRSVLSQLSLVAPQSEETPPPHY